MTINLRTNWLGLELENPFVPSSSPLSKDIGTARQLEDNGAAAIVMYSLFEEEIEAEEARAHDLAEFQDIGHGEASSYLPTHTELPGHRDKYLEQLRGLKESLDIPVIASLNGTTLGGWVRHARVIEEAGADALELNVYYVAADVTESGRDVEQRVVDILTDLRRQVSLPISVKLSPNFSSVGHLAKRLEEAGANGLSLFNRFYQPDVDLESLSIDQSLHLSNSADALLAMRWIAILHGRVDLALAATGGVHTPEDALKMLLCGADVCYLCSTLLTNGPGQLRRLIEGLVEWLTEHEYESLEQLRGSMSQQHCPDPVAFERGNYMKILGSYRLPARVWS
jgi:dihydroorotate dehydrogenase (fumarate)